jgi:hypothetical protein
MKTKPRIFRENGEWVCRYISTQSYYIRGTGATPKEAFLEWHRKYHRVATLPRHSVWNKRACLAWWHSGCPPISEVTWHADSSTVVVLKHIIGYDPKSDRLLLRG